jgi:hypothetical protein
VLQGAYVGVPVRYALSIVPAMAAAGVPVLAGRWARWVVAVVALAAVLTVGVALR